MFVGIAVLVEVGGAVAVGGGVVIKLHALNIKAIEKNKRYPRFFTLTPSKRNVFLDFSIHSLIGK